MDVLGSDGKSLPENLEVLELHTLSLVEKRFRELSSLLALGGTHEHGAQFASLEPEELLGVPGVEGLLGLLEITDRVHTQDYDLIVVDCPSTASSLRLLGSPAMVLDYIERVWPQQQRMIAVAGTDPRLLVFVSLVERIVSSLGRVRDLLSDRDVTSIRLVTTAESIVLIETRRTLAALALSQTNVDAVFVNNLLPQFDSAESVSPAQDWSTRRRASQDAAVKEFEASAGLVRTRSVTLCADEPVGLADLGAIAQQMYGRDEDAAALLDANVPPIRVGLESGAGLESVYVMRMYLPLVDASTLTLGRVEDDLVVGAEGVRRRVRLASVLRRCIVSGAELDAQDLVVRFVPDPQVWPA